MKNKFAILPKDSLPFNHHIVRYIKPRFYSINNETGAIDFKDNAFFPTDKDEAADKALSVNWLEIFADNLDDQLLELGKNPGSIYHKNGQGKLAYLHVKTVLDSLSDLRTEGFNSDIIYSPTHSTPSHASIVNIPLPSHGQELLKQFNVCMIMSVLQTFPATPKAF